MTLTSIGPTSISSLISLFLNSINVAMANRMSSRSLSGRLNCLVNVSINLKKSTMAVRYFEFALRPYKTIHDLISVEIASLILSETKQKPFIQYSLKIR